MTIRRDVFYRSKEILELAGITYRQLDFWTRQGYLAPVFWSRGTNRPTSQGGSGVERRYPTSEAIKACAIARMVEDGITVEAAAYLVQRGRYATLQEHPLPAWFEEEDGAA